MSDRTCTKCEHPHHAKGYCTLHYQRWKKFGDADHTDMVRGGYNHGMSRTPTWYSWIAMIARATDPNVKQYADYGGRGITVCDRWRYSRGFLNFLEDMGERPEGKTLDRIDNNKGYYPDNCKWSTWVEQANNRRPRSLSKK